MSGFDPEWLALREPADAAARSLRLTRLVADVLSQASVRAVDLASGTGANVRHLAPHLPMVHDWLVVEHDPQLVARALATAGRPVVARCVDLDPEAGGPPPELFEGRDLVTASALLDLVSERWIEAMIARCREAGAVVLFALTYNGEIRCAPRDADDDSIRDLVNEHQRSDKGFGPALGPASAVYASECLTAHGYCVERDESPWTLTPDRAELQRRLIAGWAEAASEIAPTRARSIASWRDRRMAHVAAGESRLIVGHEDVAAWLPHSP